MSINVSENELLAVLKRLFEHLGDANYDYGACAESVVWLESHQLDGVRTLETVLDQLLEKRHLPTEIVSAHPERFEINAGGQTLFAIAPVAIDLGVSMLSRSDQFQLTIKNATNPHAIIHGIHRSSRYSASMAAWWRDGDEPILHLVHRRNGIDYPQYDRFELGQDERFLAGAVTLVCGSETVELSESLPDTAQLEVVETIVPEAFAKRKAHTLANGIEIENESFERLCAVADKVLVEATANSRSGAGE